MKAWTTPSSTRFVGLGTSWLARASSEFRNFVRCVLEVSVNLHEDVDFSKLDQIQKRSNCLVINVCLD
jgi:hypothetical protein